MQTRDSFETGGPDPIDLTLPARPPRRFNRRLDVLLHSRVALGLTPAAAPSLVFVSVALAVLGVFVGLGLQHSPRPLAPNLLAAASTEALVTMTVAGLAMWLLLARWALPVEVGPAIVGLALGLCASASSAGAAERFDDLSHKIAAEIANLDDVLPILVGGVLIAGIAAVGPIDAVRLTFVTAGFGLLTAVAGALLFERARGASEQLVFVLGIIVLLGGTAAYLSLSPLLSGLVAGAFWTVVPGTSGAVLRATLRKIQHPLVVVLLILAGASIQFTRGLAWLVAPFVLFRLTGKLAGGWIAARIVGRLGPSDLGAHLVSPGVLGIAFAFSVQQVVPAAAGGVVVSVVALGSLAGEVLALVVAPHEQEPLTAVQEPGA